MQKHRAPVRQTDSGGASLRAGRRRVTDCTHQTQNMRGELQQTRSCYRPCGSCREGRYQEEESSVQRQGGGHTSLAARSSVRHTNGGASSSGGPLTHGAELAGPEADSPTRPRVPWETSG